MGKIEGLTEGLASIGDLIDEDDATGEGLREQAEVISDIAAEVLGDLDDDENDDLEWVRFNEIGLEAAIKRIRRMVPKFMKRAGIKDVNDLSLANPPFKKKVRVISKEIDWWTFVTRVTRDLFPDLTNKQYGVSKINFANLIIKEVIIPIALLGNDQPPELDIKRIEEMINDLLALRIKKQAEYST